MEIRILLKIECEAISWFEISYTLIFDKTKLCTIARVIRTTKVSISMYLYSFCMYLGMIISVARFQRL